MGATERHQCALMTAKEEKDVEKNDEDEDNNRRRRSTSSSHYCINMFHSPKVPNYAARYTLNSLLITLD